METWLPIPGYEGRYEASDLGQVRSLIGANPHILKPAKFRTKDYLKVSLSNGGGQRYLLVHRVVLLAFVGPCPDGMETRHLNGEGTDNRLENLCYGTHQENIADTVRHGHQERGERHHSSKLTKGQVIAIRRMFGPKIGETSYVKVAARYGVSARCIYSVVKRITWKQVH